MVNKDKGRIMFKIKEVKEGQGVMAIGDKKMVMEEDNIMKDPQKNVRYSPFITCEN